MIWDEIKNQEFAVQVLKGHIQKGRLPTAYLITGENQNLRESMALSLACALNCEEEKLFDFCSCTSCRKLTAQNHPDFRILRVIAPAKSIKIEQVRDLLNWVYLKPYEGRWKVFVISEADRLTVEASNALLKTLEEPPKQTLFCLLLAGKSQVLETIQSRSFELRLNPLPENEFSQESFKELFFPETPNANWEDLLEGYEGASKEDTGRFLTALMMYFRKKLEKQSNLSETGGGLLKGIESIYQTREALEANVNQKLALSWLTMQLRKSSRYEEVCR